MLATHSAIDLCDPLSTWTVHRTWQYYYHFGESVLIVSRQYKTMSITSPLNSRYLNYLYNKLTTISNLKKNSPLTTNAITIILIIFHHDSTAIYLND